MGGQGGRGGQGGGGGKGGQSGKGVRVRVRANPNSSHTACIPSPVASYILARSWYITSLTLAPHSTKSLQPFSTPHIPHIPVTPPIPVAPSSPVAPYTYGPGTASVLPRTWAKWSLVWPEWPSPSVCKWILGKLSKDAFEGGSSTRSGLYAIYGSNFAKIIGQVVSIWAKAQRIYFTDLAAPR